MHTTSKIDTSITDPETVVAVYNTHSEAEGAVKQIKADKYLVLAHGTAEEVDKAKAILGTTKPADLDEHARTGTRPSAASASERR
jgi:hypothetical protein